MPDAQKKDIDKFQTLPQAARDFLLSEQSSEANVKIVEKFKLSPEEEDLFFEITDKVIYKELKLENFLAEVKKFFKFNKEVIKKLSLEILGTIFLPIESYLGDVQGEIKKIGGAPGSFAVKRIETEEITPEILVKRILAETEIGLDKNLLKKFEAIIRSRFSDARDEEETSEALTRVKKLGGLELGAEDAKKISENLEAKLKSVKLFELKPEPAVEKEPEKKVIKRSSAKPASGTVGNSTSYKLTAKKEYAVYGAEDEREVSHVARQLEKRGVETKIDFSEEVKKSTDKIAKYGKISFVDENAKKKFSNIISARLRDIRDEMETMEILTRDKGVGGLGLAPEIAKEISLLIETEFQLLSEARKARELQKHKDWEQTTEAEKINKEEGQKTEEQKRLDEKYQKIVKNISSKVKAVDIEKTKIIGSEAPNSGELMVKVKSARPVAPSGKPLVEDISFTPKLLGPIDELRGMTLVDFRRLGKNPMDTTEKIKDKIDLLEDESHLKKMEGLAAWRESEISKIYFEIMRQCLNNGKSVDEIIATRNAGKILSLTPDEFKAVMKLFEIMRI